MSTGVQLDLGVENGYFMALYLTLSLIVHQLFNLLRCTYTVLVLLGKPTD